PRCPVRRRLPESAVVVAPAAVERAAPGVGRGRAAEVAQRRLRRISKETPLLSRGGESRRGSGGWGGVGQENHSLDQHHPVCAGQGGFATFCLPRSHPSSSEEGSLSASGTCLPSSESAVSGRAAVVGRVGFLEFAIRTRDHFESG